MKGDKKYPLVSVGIPTYNSNKTVLTALESILHQQYPNLEVIISDNSSTDDTQEICRKISYKNPSIKYFRQEKNIGLVPNFEFVLQQASGYFFMWIADDDTLEPGVLQKYVDFLIANPDYHLVSGRIQYWHEGNFLFCENNFNIKHIFRNLRVVNYYFKVVHGALYYGLMRREAAIGIPLRNRIGDDWHFVASLAYLGKIRNMECVGYNKKLNGISKNFKHYAKVIGASRFSANFPHLTIATDAFLDILFRSPVYFAAPMHSRIGLALFSSISILINFYFKVYPFIIGGKMKRLAQRSINVFRTNLSGKKDPLLTGLPSLDKKGEID